jgi:hypothetical protein
MRACILFSLVVLGAALERKSDLAITDIAEVNYALARGKPVFYQIVMGSFPFRRQYKLWLGALREAGKYDGTVVMVTDKPECIANGLGPKLLGGEREYTDENVDIYPGTGNGKIHILKVFTPRSVLGIKMHKSKAWANIQKAKIDHPVSSIVYTDTDVVVAQDINEWLKYEKSLEKKRITLALFPDIGQLNDVSQNLHTGVVVMFPTVLSQRCIKSWGRQLGGGSDDPAPIHHFGSSLLQQGGKQHRHRSAAKGVDQQALIRAQECKAEDGILKMPEHYLSIPDAHDLQKKKTTLFMHITNTGKWKTIHKDTKAKFFYKVLGLSEDIDYETKGSCPREMWDTPAYKKLNEKHKEEALENASKRRFLDETSEAGIV